MYLHVCMTVHDCVYIHVHVRAVVHYNTQSHLAPVQLTSIKLPGHDLGRSVVGAATAGAQELSVLHEVAEAKVGYLDIVL